MSARYDMAHCADCLYDLCPVNMRVQKYDSVDDMFDAIERLEPGRTLLSASGGSVSVFAEVMWQGTPLCMPHFRERWQPPQRST